MIRKLRKHFLKLFIAWVVITIATVFFALRSEYVADKAYHYLLAYLEEKLQSRVEMGRPKIAWIRGSWYIKDLSIMPDFGREKTAIVAAKSVRISFFPWFNVLRREIGISSIELEAPSVYLRIEKGKIANLPSLGFLKGPKGFFRFALREVRISDGRMAVSDPEMPVEIAFNGIQMKVRPDLDKKQYGFILSDSSADIKVKEFSQKIMSMKGDFRVTPENLTIIKSAFRLHEGSVSAEGLYWDFATGKWVTKLSSELNLAALREVVSGQWPVVSEKMKDLKGRVNLSATIKGDRDGFDAGGRAGADEIELDGFKIRNTTSTFATKGRWDMMAESPFEIELRSRIPVELASHYLENAPGLKGVADVHLKWAGLPRDFKIDGDIVSTLIELSGIPLNKVSARFNADREGVGIEDLTASLLGGSLRGMIALELKESAGFRGKVQVRGIGLNEVSGRVTAGGPFRVSGRASGDIELAGALRPGLKFDGSSRIEIEELGISHGEWLPAKVPRCTISANLSYDNGLTRLTSLDIETPSSMASFSGDISAGRVSLSVNLRNSDLTEFGGLIKGSGTLKGRVSGPPGSPEFEGSLALRKVLWDRYRADAVSGDIRFREGAFSTTGLDVVIGGSEASIKGDISPAKDMLDASAEMKKGRLEDIASLAGIEIGMKGNLSARGRVKGGFRSLDGEIEIRGAGVNIAGEGMDAVNIRGRLIKGRLLLEKGEALRGSERVSVEGEIGADGDASLRVSSTPLSIRDIQYMRKKEIPLEGTVEISGEVSGNIKEPGFKGVVSCKGVRYRDVALGSGSLAVSISDRLLTASGNLFGSEIAGNLTLRGNKPFHIHLSTTDLPLDQFFKGSARLEGVSGAVSGTLEVDGEISDLREVTAKGSLSRLQLVRDPFFLRNTGEIEMEIRNERVIFKSFQLSGRGTELSASGWIGMDGETSLSVQGSADLYLLQLFTGIIDKGGGIADLSLNIYGKPPRIEGRVVVREGVIGFKGFDLLFSDISGNVTLKGETLIVETVSGRVGEGGFKGGGSIEMSGLRPKTADISFDMSGVHLSYPRWLPGEVEGSLRLSGEYPSFLLSGDVNVIIARYSERIDWRTFLPSFRQRLREPLARKEGEGALRLDINFKAPRNLIFENNVGKGEMKGEIRLTGDTSRFGIVGDVEVISGRVFYKDHEFRINSGIIEFPDPNKVEAVFDFSAEGKVRDYTIQILAQGNINDLKVTMTSSPPLSELDIASLLSLGLTTKEFQERGGGAPVYGAASILTREVEDKFKDYVGFDRFHIDPYYSRATGTTEPKLTVGKDIAEDVLVRYSRGLSGAGEQEVQMEYRLYRNFSLLGGWSSFGATGQGDLGADMKFRFEFR